MGRTVGWAVAAALLVGAPACGSDEGDGATSAPAQAADDSGAAGDDPQAYVDAIAATIRYDDPADDYDIALSEAVSTCYGEAYVEVVGVERLAAEATAQEIEASPEKEADDWGIEVTDAEGTEIFRALVGCSPAAMGEISTWHAAQLGSSDPPMEVDAACLAEADPASIEDLVGSKIAASDDSEISETQAERMVAWMWPCGDLRGALLGPITSDPSVSEGAAACLDAAVDDETLRAFLAAAIVAEDETALVDSPAGSALMDAIAPCEGLGD